MKCPTPKKVKYKNSLNAEKACTRIINEIGKEKATTYKCICGWWHWTSQRRNLSEYAEKRLEKMRIIKKLFGTNRKKAP